MKPNGDHRSHPAGLPGWCTITLLTAISVPYLRTNAGRILLTLLGVVIGVQGMVAMGALTVFGVDLLEQVGKRNPQFPREHVHIPDELRFLNATDSIALGQPLLDRLRMGIGSSIRLSTPEGVRTFTVRGSLDPVGPAKLFAGACLGILEGFPASFFMVTHSLRVAMNWSVDFTFPTRLAVSTLATITLAAAAAGYIPARRITTGTVLAGLETE